MRAKIYWILAVVGVFAGLSWPATPADSEIAELPDDSWLTSTETRVKRYLMEGLQGVEVMIVGLASHGEKYGFTKDQLQTDIEARLQQDGIRVFSFEESMLIEGTPTLLVSLDFKTDPNIGYTAASIIVELTELVFLARAPEKFCRSRVWSYGSTELVETNNAKSIQDIVGNHVDEFINDYLAANPKKGPVKSEE